MARTGALSTAIAVLVFSSLAQADISPTATFIKTRPYQQLSSEDWLPLNADDPTIDGPEDIDKASGIIPSVGKGRVVWADGRTGNVVTMGYDLVTDSGEFLVSKGNPLADAWQEGNPFVGVDAAGAHRTVYDATQVGVPSADPGDIQAGVPNPPPPAPPGSTAWVVQTPVTLTPQLTPVFTNLPQQTLVSWINHPGTPSKWPGYANTEIYRATFTTPATNIMPVTTTLAPRDNLEGDGKYLVWQELVEHDWMTQQSSWDIVVYDCLALSFRYIDGPAATHKNQIDPDVSGRLVVFTQEEDPSGTGSTNVYFLDLASPGGAGPVPITTSGAAARAAISKATNDDDGNYFVVWQNIPTDDPDEDFFPSHPVGHGEWDFNWDIWAQEIQIGASGEYELHKDAFVIRADPGRQTHPDIDGLDVVWQTQAPDDAYIYVWGPIPEPCTVLVLAAGMPFLLGGRRRRRGSGPRE